MFTTYDTATDNFLQTVAALSDVYIDMIRFDNSSFNSQLRKNPIQYTFFCTSVYKKNEPQKCLLNYGFKKSALERNLPR